MRCPVCRFPTGNRNLIRQSTIDPRFGKKTFRSASMFLINKNICTGISCDSVSLVSEMGFIIFFQDMQIWGRYILLLRVAYTNFCSSPKGCDTFFYNSSLFSLYCWCNNAWINRLHRAWATTYIKRNNILFQSTRNGWRY